jgi:SpoVK/Ycf46/Vps4 family AAA+-type ATPase
MEKNNNIRTTLSFLENYLSEITKAVLNQANKNEYFFDKAYMTLLKKQCDEIVVFCDEIERDRKLCEAINLQLKAANNIATQFTIRQFFISDCIVLYRQLNKYHSEKTGFTIAYFYDAIFNNHFANENAIDTLNEILSQPEFKKHLQGILSKNQIRINTNDDTKMFLPSALKKNNHPLFAKIKIAYNNFVALILEKQQVDKTQPEIQKILNQIANPDVSINTDGIPDDDTLEKVLAELQAMIGLEEVKKDINDLVNLIKVQKIREQQGLKNPDASLHIVFLGPPGTGKTSVARLLGRIYKHLGMLDKGHLLETDREGMVAGYVGQTAIKVDEIVERSIEGVLFIDEAYSLSQDVMGNDFGKEAIDSLVKRMEDNRKNLAVIMAGYTEPMKALIESNPGLRSRFNRYFKFDHFTPEQLLEIFKTFCTKSDFVIDNTATEKLHDTFVMLYEKRDEGFGNARVVRNLFEKCVQTHANRIVSIPDQTPQILKTLTEADIPEPKKTVAQVYFTV